MLCKSRFRLAAINVSATAHVYNEAFSAKPSRYVILPWKKTYLPAQKPAVLATDIKKPAITLAGFFLLAYFVVFRYSRLVLAAASKAFARGNQGLVLLF